MDKVYEIIIIGGGPAGHTSAIYSARALLSPLLFEGFMAGGMPAGGQLMTTKTIENFPGFPEGIGGQELMQKMRTQSIELGTEILTETIEEINTKVYPFEITSKGKVYKSKSIIIATGATAKRLFLPGEAKFWGRGVSACAICDGGLPIFRDKSLIVIGGGDAAIEEAIHLTHFAKEVFILVRKDIFRASKHMQNKVTQYEKIKVLRNTEVQEFCGDDLLGGVRVINNKTKQEEIIACNGAFYSIGHTPNTTFLKGQIKLDEEGYIITKANTTQTNIEGIFAAGDVQDKVFRQAITAAGSGCMAALEVEKWLEENK